VKSSSLDTVAKAISSLNDVYHKDAKLSTILSAPTLSPEDKSQIVAELQKHTGGADKDITIKNFLTTLADYNRLGLLKGVCEKFGELMSAARGEIEMTVTSAAVGFPSRKPLLETKANNNGDIGIRRQDAVPSRSRCC
jgi:F-type H+-transporting ATPase subunit O